MPEETKPPQKIHARSHQAVLAWSLSSVVNALRLTVSSGLPVGNETLSLLNNLRTQIETKGEKGLGLMGVAIDNIPKPTQHTAPADVLVIAEALNGLIQCFLEPDEREQQQAGMGYHTMR